MTKYICKRKCTYGGRLWEKGAEMETDAQNVPKHFVAIAETVNQNPNDSSEKKGRGNPNWVKK